MSVLLQIGFSARSAAVCSQAGLLMLHFELGRPAQPVTAHLDTGFTMWSCVYKRQSATYKDMCVLWGCLRKGGRRGLGHGQPGLFPKLSIREKAFLFPLGVLGWATERPRVFLCPRFVHDEIKTRKKNRKDFSSTLI